MSARGIALTILLAASIAAGTIAETPLVPATRVIGGYQVLAADFHVHMFPMTWSTLAPWDTVIEARYQGLDAIALTPHNAIWQARIGRWFSRLIDGPIVIVGEEITAPGYHLLAIGITERVPQGLAIHAAIDEVHRQRGVAIVAHPYSNVWRTFDAVALDQLDGAEVVRPEAQVDERAGAELRAFFSRAPLTAIGDSDYHGLGPMGFSRTYIFARARTAEAVVEAVREGRTVVYDRSRVYGDPAMIRLASDAGGLPHDVPDLPSPGAAKTFSRFAGLVALAGLLLFNRMR